VSELPPCERCGGRGWLRQITVGIDLVAGEPVCSVDSIDCPGCRAEGGSTWVPRRA
jgi:hypothetical protein